MKKHFREKFEREGRLIGVMAIDNPLPFNPLIDGHDLLLLTVLSEAEDAEQTEHLLIEGRRVQIRTVTERTLKKWIAGGDNRSIILWLVRGEILLDRDNYLLNLRESMLSFPESLRKQKQLIEFSGFIRTYLKAKQDLKDNQLLDAYSNILTALHHWAHIALIEAGVHPELTVWKQMKRFNPGIYKLYEELTVSPETLEQRVQLVMLACEFSVMNKMKTSCELLFTIMTEREEPWSIMELQQRPELAEMQLDLSLLLQKLVNRGYIREVAVLPDSGDTDALELRYSCEKSNYS